MAQAGAAEGYTPYAMVVAMIRFANPGIDHHMAASEGSLVFIPHADDDHPA